MTQINCATCPLARHIDGDRYSCIAVHNHHNPVTRGHWQATADCEQAIDGYHVESAQTELDAYIEQQAEAVAPEPDDRGSGRQKQPQSVSLATASGQLFDRDRILNYQQLTFEVIGSTGNLYPVLLDTRKVYPQCTCKGSQHGKRCYHADAVLAAWRQMETSLPQRHLAISR